MYLHDELTLVRARSPVNREGRKVRASTRLPGTFQGLLVPLARFHGFSKRPSKESEYQNLATPVQTTSSSLFSPRENVVTREVK